MQVFETPPTVGLTPTGWRVSRSVPSESPAKITKTLEDAPFYARSVVSGTLLGEPALVVAMRRPSTAIALDNSSVIRIARSLFQRVLESDPAAARRLRDEFAARTSQIASDILMAGGKLST